MKDFNYDYRSDYIDMLISMKFPSDTLAYLYRLKGDLEYFTLMERLRFIKRSDGDFSVYVSTIAEAFGWFLSVKSHGQIPLPKNSETLKLTDDLCKQIDRAGKEILCDTGYLWRTWPYCYSHISYPSEWCRYVKYGICLSQISVCAEVFEGEITDEMSESKKLLDLWVDGIYSEDFMNCSNEFLGATEVTQFIDLCT